MRHETRPPTTPPTRARRGLLVGGLVLVAAGVAVVAWVLAVAAGLVGGDRLAMDNTPRTLTLEGGPSTSGDARPRPVAYRLEPADGPATTVRLEVAADPAARTQGLMGRTAVPDGTGMVFLPRFDTTAVIEQLPRCTVFMGVPTFYTRLLADPAFDAACCRSIR